MLWNIFRKHNIFVSNQKKVELIVYLMGFDFCYFQTYLQMKENVYFLH